VEVPYFISELSTQTAFSVHNYTSLEFNTETHVDGICKYLQPFPLCVLPKLISLWNATL